MQVPPQPTTASWDSLPNDVKLLVVPMIACSNVHEVAKTILALNLTNRFFHNFVTSQSGIFSILERMPYIQNSVDLADLLVSRPMLHFKFEEGKIWRYYCELRTKLKNGPALSIAVESNNTQEVQNLLRCKYIALNFAEWANCADWQDRANTPLSIAIDMENEEISIALIKAGANLTSFNRYFQTPLECANRTGQKTIAKLLIAYGAKC